MIKKLLLTSLLSVLTLSVMADDRQKPTYEGSFVQPVEGETMYLYNVGAAQFYCDGNDWNTHASVGEAGIQIQPTATGNTNEGAAEYTLRDYPLSKNNWLNAFITETDGILHLYTDGGDTCEDLYFCFQTLDEQAHTFKIYPSERNVTYKHSGQYENYFITVDPEYVNHVSGQTTGTGVVYAPEAEGDYNVWGWVSAAEHEALQEQLRTYYHAEELHTLILKAEEWDMDVATERDVYENLSATYDEITAAIEGLRLRFLDYYQENVMPTDPVDLTSYITNPGFEDNLDGWNNEGGISTFEQGSWSDMIDGTHFTGSRYLNLWNGSALNGDVSATLTGFPNGVYQLTAAAYSDAAGGYIFFGDAKVAIASGDQAESKGQDYTVATIVADGNLRFGYHSEHQGQFWSCMDNIRLTYYGDGEEAYTYWVEQNISGAPNFDNARCQPALVETYKRALTALQEADTETDVSAYIAAFTDALNAVKANINAYNKLEEMTNQALEEKDSYYEYYQALLETYAANTVTPALQQHTASTEEVVALQQEIAYIISEAQSTFDLNNQLDELESQLEADILKYQDSCTPEALANAQALSAEVSKAIVDETIENNEGYRDYISKVEAAIKQLRTPVQPGTDDNPVDYSVYIANADFEQGITGWSRKGQISTFETATWGIDGTYLTGNAYLNLWDGSPSGTIYQDITGLPNGMYSVSVSAFCNRDNTMVVFAGTDKVVVEGAETISGVATYTINTRVTDGVLRVGITMNNEATDAWAVADNFTLTSYCEDSSLKPTGDQTSDPTPAGQDLPFILGADISWYTEMEAAGYTFVNANGFACTCPELLQPNGLNAARLRVWVNPENGYNGKADVLQKAREIHQLGMDLMIDFHFSDTWADPGAQTIPAAWGNDNITELRNHLKEHVTDILSTLTDEGISPRWVQIGNETNNGLMWPLGNATDNPNNYRALMADGYDAVKQVCPDAQVIVHLSSAPDQGLYNWNLALLNANKFDIIGMSLYPENEEDVTKTVANIKQLANRFSKDCMVVEAGLDVTDASSPQLMQTILNAMYNDTEGHCLGVFYWEPESYNGWNNYGKGAALLNGKRIRFSPIMNAFKEMAETVGIREINDEGIVNRKSANSTCYDLTGRHISTSSALPKGIYIVGGRKVVRSR